MIMMILIIYYMIMIMITMMIISPCPAGKNDFFLEKGAFWCPKCTKTGGTDIGHESELWYLGDNDNKMIMIPL